MIVPDSAFAERSRITAFPLRGYLRSRLFPFLRDLDSESPCNVDESSVELFRWGVGEKGREYRPANHEDQR